MKTVKVSVTLPEDLVREMKRLTDNLSGFVAAGMREYVERVRAERALSGSAGAWEAGEHPELASLDDVEGYVAAVRRGWLREA
jgi:post-segregation antitoxin (ccd killing protein)